MSTESIDSDRERQLFELLDGYLCSLNGEPSEAAEPPDELLAAFPELGDLLDCLDSLESLAVPSFNGGAGCEGDSAQAEALVPGSTPAPTGDEPSSATGGTDLGDFGRYELLEEVGRGGMGVVYRARQKALDATVALKVVRSSQFASAEEIRRFYAEARAAAGLRHPNIVCVHDVGDCFGQHYLTMDFVEAGSLAGKLADGPLDPREAAELLGRGLFAPPQGDSSRLEAVEHLAR